MKKKVCSSKSENGFSNYDHYTSNIQVETTNIDKLYTICTFIDFSCAFHSIDHKILKCTLVNGFKSDST